jgi:hypothetical protein
MGEEVMTTATHHHRYKATETKYKGRAREMYVTYDLPQETRGDGRTVYSKVQRVYIAGEVTGWRRGTFEKRTGKKVHGVKIDYEQGRSGYARRAYTASRGGSTYQVHPTRVGGGVSHFSKVVEVPEGARNVEFHKGRLPKKYQDALQNVR